MLDGYHPRRYEEYKAKVDAVVAMLGQLSDLDRPDPDEDIPPAFRSVL